MKKKGLSFSVILIIIGLIIIAVTFLVIMPIFKSSNSTFTSLADSNSTKQNSFFTAENINITTGEDASCSEEDSENREYECDVDGNISLIVGLKAISSKSLIVFPRIAIINNDVCDDEFSDCKVEDLIEIESNSCLIFPGEITECKFKLITLNEGEYRIYPAGRCESSECLNLRSGNYQSKDLININPNSFITVSVD